MSHFWLSGCLLDYQELERARMQVDHYSSFADSYHELLSNLVTIPALKEQGLPCV